MVKWAPRTRCELRPLQLLGAVECYNLLTNLGQALMQVNLYEAKTRLSELIEAASAGKTVVIAKAGRPMALLGPLPKKKRRIKFGLMKGQIKIADDFDAPLPDDILDLFEG